MIEVISALKSKPPVAGAWVSKTPFGTTKLSSVYYYGGYWVVAGASGLLAYATSPTGTWTTVTSGFGTSDLFDCRYGNGYWVAVGDAGKLATCPTNPTGTWTLHASPGFGTDTIYGICYGNGGWTGVASNGVLRTASDPTSTWTANTSGFSTSLIFNVEYQNSIWVIVGNDGKIATATDCTSTWTMQDLGSQAWRGLGYGNGYWVITNASANGISYASDPTSTWTANSLAYIYEGCLYANGYWALSPHISNGPFVRRATDPTSTFSNTSTTPSNSVYDIHYESGIWVGVGAAGMFFVSK